RGALHAEPVVQGDAKLDDPRHEQQQGNEDECELDRRLTALAIAPVSDASEVTSTHGASRPLSERCSVSFSRVARSGPRPKRGSESCSSVMLRKTYAPTRSRG